jgi:hypothetical protein
MYTCVYVYRYVSGHVCRCAGTSVPLIRSSKVLRLICIHVCVCACKCPRLFVKSLIYIHMFLCKYAHACTLYKYKYTYKYTCMYTCLMLRPFLPFVAIHTPTHVNI